MKTSEYISFTIDRLPIGYVFTYVEFISEVSKKEAVIKALKRMAALGKIAKLHRLSIYKRSTEELLEITSSEDKWNPKAVNQAKEELRKRNVSDKAITNANI